MSPIRTLALAACALALVELALRVEPRHGLTVLEVLLVDLAS